MMNVNRSIYLGWLAMASTIGLIITNLGADRGSIVILRVLGVAFLLFSPFLFIPPFIFLAKVGKPDEGRTYIETSIVVRQGPFRIIRHPQYLGYMFLNLGFMLLVQSWVALMFASLSIGIFVTLAVEEEKQLHARFGEDYAEYCQDVPRFNLIVGLLRYMRSSSS
jgi:protein-S-isoprenylcysteine O-methyltransferase Ste14